ncbi:MAG: cation:proton antiporter [Nanoarchaeota archaeon]
MDFLLLICIILGFSFVFSKFLEKVNLPRIIAPLMLGILFNYFDIISSSEYINILEFLSSFAIMMLLFYIGLELNLKDTKELEKETFFFAMFGFVISFFLGFLTFYFLFNQSFITSFVIGSILSVAGETVLVVILEQNKLLKTKVGEIIIGATLIDNILGLLLIGIISILATSQMFEIMSFLPIIIAIVIFILGVFFLRYIAQFIDYIFINSNFKVYDVFTCSIIFLFLFAFVSHFLGLDISLGAIMFGLLLNFSLNKVGIVGEDEEHDINRFVKNITFGFLFYFFFFWVGFNFEINMFLSSPMLGIIFILIAFVGKYFSGLISSYFSKDTFSNGSIIGIGMATKGGVELIIAEIARKAGLISIEIFSGIVFMSLVLIFICPIVFSVYLKFKNKHDLL